MVLPLNRPIRSLHLFNEADDARDAYHYLMQVHLYRPVRKWCLSLEIGARKLFHKRNRVLSTAWIFSSLEESFL